MLTGEDPKKMARKTGLFASVGGDLAAGLVVFFVALPLCLGVALASGAPLFSGVIAGIVGGIVVGALSRSQLSVSGPAAGLTAIVLDALTELGAFELLLAAVVVAGVIQVALGFLRAGGIADYLPSNVIEGMLAGIGIIIIMKQVPYALGYDPHHEVILHGLHLSGGEPFANILDAANHVSIGAIIVTVVAFAILRAWDRVPKLKRLVVLPGPFVAVVVGVALSEVLARTGPLLAIQGDGYVNLPIAHGAGEFFGQFTLPDFGGFANREVLTVGLTIAIVASLETLLSVEAVDRLDPRHRVTPPNRELKAQGIGNIVSGLIGGIPITAVIVRSSANVAAGATSKVATITHGVLLLVSVATIPFLLDRIPLAVLAAVLILTGFKLANPRVFRRMWGEGLNQFVPFVVTALGVVFTDLLIGVALGLVVSVVFLLRASLESPFSVDGGRHAGDETIRIRLAERVSFLNKAVIKARLEGLPANASVVIDASKALYIDHDIRELIKEFAEFKAPDRGIRLELVGFEEKRATEAAAEPSDPADGQGFPIRTDATGKGREGQGPFSPELIGGASADRAGI
jgi:MFS superfamily sulfate permease-like transporter